MNEKGQKIVLGLTGGMACGKSAAAEMLEEMGWGRVDTDQIVRELLTRDPAVVEQVVGAFGAEVAGADGAINRRRLAGIVFADSDALARLEGILHPRVREAWKARVAEPAPAHWVVEIPLLFENGLEKEVDFTVCIACDPSVQAQRLATRGLPPHEASRRIARQLPLAQKIERADFVITNNGSLVFLRNQVNRLARTLTTTAD